MSEPTLAEVTDLLRSVSDRLDVIERRLTDLEARTEIPEDVVLAISAAVAAYLGHRAKVRAIHFSRPGSWAEQGRQAVQSRAVSPIR
ncbi:MAG TPA: hypothetical protein GXZ30_14135 [Propionibacterium sp.]|nr:hypothetical protein [Propionibacterium sp.]